MDCSPCNLPGEGPAGDVDVVIGGRHGQRSRSRSAPPHLENADAPAGDDGSPVEDIEKVDEPQLKAMFETAAEVLGGLKKAFSDFERKNDSAWRG